MRACYFLYKYFINLNNFRLQRMVSSPITHVDVETFILYQFLGVGKQVPDPRKSSAVLDTLIAVVSNSAIASYPRTPTTKAQNYTSVERWMTATAPEQRRVL